MEHLTDSSLEHYRAGALEDSGDYARIEQHLNACDVCRTRFAKPGAPVSAVLMRSLAEWSHAEDEALLHFAKNPANAPPEIADHVANCRRCQDDVAGLRAYLMAQPATASVLPTLQNDPGTKLAAADATGNTRRWRKSLPTFTVGLTTACFATLLLFTISLKHQVERQVTQERLAREQEETLRHTAQITQQEAQKTSQELQQARHDLASKGDVIAGLQASLTAKEIKARQMQAQLHAAVAPLLPVWRISHEDIAALHGRDPDRRLMGLDPNVSDKQALKLLGPVGRTLDVQPLLHWKPITGAVRYIITLADAHDNLIGKPVSVAGATGWRRETTLAPGRYTWQVEAYKQDSPANFAVGTAHFEVLSPRSLPKDKAVQLESWAQTHLRLGDLYAEAGMFEEAEHQYQDALRLKPADAAIQKRLKAALKQQGKF